jgi:regulator of protease activity HflC (stomatin/prohibitin superfamily)
MTTATETFDAVDPAIDEELPTIGERIRQSARKHSFALLLVSLLLVFTAVVFWPRIVITVHSGEEGAMWSRWNGTQLSTVYKEGTHLIWPWNEMFIYDIRINKVDYDVPVLSTDGLEIKVAVSIRYRPAPKTVPQLHQTIGPQYVERVVIPEVVTAVREVMGAFRPDQLYTLRTVEMQNQIVARAATQVQDRFVTIDDVLIRRIELPEALQVAIQSKLRQEQAALEYRYRLDREQAEATRKQIEADGIVAFQQRVFGGSADINAQRYLTFKGIEATLELAKSNNAKVVVVGSGPNGLPLILNPDTIK